MQDARYWNLIVINYAGCDFFKLKGGDRIFHLACSNGLIDVVRLMIEKGADCDSLNKVFLIVKFYEA